MQIRKYKPSDCPQTEKLFYETVHTVNAGDYNTEQLHAWATGALNSEQWNQSFLAHESYVAIKDGMIVGFGDIAPNGYLDRLYVHKDYQRQGIATAICDILERKVMGDLTTHASITAKPFFEKRGYRVITAQEVLRNGVSLQNFIMRKTRDIPEIPDSSNA